MAQKFLYIDANGLIHEVEAPTVSAGSTSAGLLVALDSNGKIDTTFLPDGIGVDSLVAPCSEAIAAGALLNLWYDSANSLVKWRNADKATAAGAKECHAYAKAAFASGANCTGFFEGGITGLSGLTPGGRCWLGNSGAIIQTVTTTSGETLQRIGVAKSATTVDFEKGDPIIRA